MHLRIILLNLLSRGSTSLSIIILPLAAGSILGLEKLGLFLIFFSAITSASVASRLGLDTATLKLAGKDWGEITHNKKQVFLCSVLGALFGGVLINALVLLFFIVFLDDKYNAFLLPLLIAIQSYSCNTIIGANLKAINKSYLSPFFDSGGAELLTLILMLFTYIYHKEYITELNLIYWITLFSVTLTLIGLSFFIFHYSLRTINFRETIPQTQKMIIGSKDFLITSLATHLTGRGVPVIIAVFFPPKTVGLYAILYTISSTVSFMSVIYNSIIPPKFSFFFQKKQMKKIYLLYKRVVIEMFIVSIIITIIIYFFLGDIAHIIKVEYNQTIIFYLSILIFAQLINVLTGPAGFLLNMTGHEVTVRNITIILSLSFVLLIFLSGISQKESSLFLSFAVVTIIRNIYLFIKTYKLFIKNRRSDN